ncbi:MAG TPA: DUF4349 domain-containing protein [Acidimicrobiales bacterium]|nr:DUF4349 domain-containing protein [Acidimicrobiales bacterium]
MRRIPRQWMVAVPIAVLLTAGAGVALVDRGDEVRPARQAATLDSESYEAAPGGNLASPGVGAGSAGREAASTGVVAPTPGPVPSAPVPGIGQSKVIKTADVRIELKRDTFSSAFASAARIASSLGGFVAGSSSERSHGRLSSGNLTLRVPADRFDEARRRIGALGTVAEERIGGEEVGGQLVDLDARLRSLRAQEEALRGLMAKARTVGETLEVQGQLSQVRMEIEQLAGEQTRLTEAVALSTVTVAMFEPGAVVPGPDRPDTGLAHALERAVDASVAVVAGTIVVLGYALPLSVLVGLALLVFRISRRRRAVVPVG